MIPTYTVNYIDSESGIPNVTYTLSDGTQNTENLASAPLDSKVNLDDFMSKYIAAYETGLADVTIKVDPAITAGIGKPQGV
jgi:hypothetical protein